MPEIELTSDDDRHRDLGAERHRDLAQRHAARRLRPLPRDLREGPPTAGGSSRRSSPGCTPTSRCRRRADAGRRRHRRGVRVSGWRSASGARRSGMDVALLDLDGERAAAEAARVAAAHGVEAIGLARRRRRRRERRGRGRGRRRALRRRRPRPVERRRAALRRGRDLHRRRVAVAARRQRHRLGPRRAGVPPAAAPGRAAAAGVHHVVVDPRSGQPPRRLPGQQVRGVGPGRDAPARARRRRHRRVGDLPVGDDHPAPRDQRGGPARPPAPARSPATATSTP